MLGAVALLTSISLGQDPAPVAASPAQTLERKAANYWVTLEPGTVFLPSGSYRLEGMRHTVVRPARLIAKTAKPELYDEAKWKQLRIGFESFKARAGQEADQRLAELKPNWKRNAEGRVMYAELSFEDPVAAGFLFATRLGEVFEKTFGERLAIVVPTPNRAFVFSARTNDLEDHGSVIHALFENAYQPASREIFLLEKGKPLRVVGLLGDEVVIQPIQQIGQ